MNAYTPYTVVYNYVFACVLRVCMWGRLMGMKLRLVIPKYITYEYEL